MMIHILIALIFLPNLYDFQNLKGCGKTYGCFSYPTNCINNECSIVFKWTLDEKESNKFILSAFIGDQLPKDSSYLAIGFSNDKQMGEDNVVICKSLKPDHPAQSNGLVQQLQTLGKQAPVPLDNANAQIGLKNVKVRLAGGFILCTFERDKQMNRTDIDYKNLNRDHFVLAAIGQLNENGDPNHHLLAMPSEAAVNFTASQNVTSSSPTLVTNRAKAHAGIMLLTWLIFASLGISIARYFKFLFPNVKVYNTKVWFLLHRPLMIFVVLMSIIAFLIILADLSWSWVKLSASLAHSVFGMLTIGLAFIQVMIAFCRPHEESWPRKIFRYGHRTLGISVFVLAIITMFIGVSLPRMHILESGIGILCGWLVWLIIFVAVIEYFQYKYAKDLVEIGNMSLSDLNKVNIKPVNITLIRNGKTLKFERIKLLLLCIHVAITLILCLTLVILIGRK